MAGLLGALALLVAACQSGYDLTVQVTDEQGAAIPGAMVALHENGQTLLTDVEGQAAWAGLEQNEASLVVVASGYVLQIRELPLERGANQVTFALAKQPEIPYQPPSS